MRVRTLKCGCIVQLICGFLALMVIGCGAGGMETAQDDEENVGPEIESTYPADDAVDVAVNTSISVVFTEPLSATTISTQNIRLTEVDTDTDIPITIEYDSANNTVILQPDSMLLDNTQYEVHIGDNPDADIEDPSGYTLAEFEWTFTTVDLDLEAPYVQEKYPEEDALDVTVFTSIILSFNEPILESSINTDSIQLVDTISDMQIPIGIAYDAATGTAVLQPLDILESYTVYQVRISGTIEDMAGNSMEEIDWAFTTGYHDDEPPEILSKSPYDGEENVGAGSVISIGFSEQMDSETINGDNIFIQLNGTTLESQVQYDSLSLEARVSLSDFLSFDTEYTMTVTTGVTDLAGNLLEIDETWAFRTEPERPIKILFALDCSGSMGAAGEGADPDNLRLDAAMEFVEHYIGNPHFSFDILLWNQDVFSSTSAYTQNIDEIRPILENPYNTGITDFVNTLNEIHSDIYTDISSAIDSDNQDLLSHTQYVVLFVSDGLDNVSTTSGGTIEPRVAEILHAVDELNDMVSERGVGRFAFHTFFLNGVVMPSEDVDEAINLLQSMANTGQGEFRIFESAEDIDFINTVEITPLEE